MAELCAKRARSRRSREQSVKLALGRTGRCSVHSAVIVAGFAVQSEKLVHSNHVRLPLQGALESDKAKSSRSNVDIATRCTAPWL